MESLARSPSRTPECTAAGAGEKLGLETLEQVYRANYDFVWRNARRLGSPDGLVEDVVHEVFMVVARRLVEFEQRSSLRTWLFSITHHTVQRLLRDQMRRERKLSKYEFALSNYETSPHARIDAARSLRTLLLGLSETKRVVFILAELEGMTSAEIGIYLGIKPATVDSRLRAARLELAKRAQRERAHQRSNTP